MDRHAFSHINNIVDLRLWSSSFDVISDEAFYKLTDTISFQLYHNNITFLGKELFLGASGVDEITIYNNIIQRVSEKFFDSVVDATNRMVLYANVFMCTCDIAWILGSPSFKEYLSLNECIFPDRSQEDQQKFRIVDLTRKDLCPLWEESTESSAEKTQGMSASTVALLRSTSGMPKATATQPPSSTTPSSTMMSTINKHDHSSSASPEEPTSHKSASTLSHTSSMKPATSKRSSDRSPVDLSTPSQDREDASLEPRTVGLTITHAVTGGPVHEGRTEASVDLEGDTGAEKDGSSAAGKATFPDNASLRSFGNLILTFSLACFCTLLRINL